MASTPLILYHCNNVLTYSVFIVHCLSGNYQQKNQAHLFAGGRPVDCKRKEMQGMESIWQLDDGHGDYNRSYERDQDFDYADYSTDHKENNFSNYEWKIPRTKKERVRNILNHYE